MIFAVFFADNADKSKMPAHFMNYHLAFHKSHGDQIEAAGPMKVADMGEPAGGLWLVQADQVEQVRTLVETDTFWPTGLRKSARILEWAQVFADGKPIAWSVTIARHRSATRRMPIDSTSCWP
jgi:uncharacterized protein YciI